MKRLFSLSAGILAFFLSLSQVQGQGCQAGFTHFPDTTNGCIIQFIDQSSGGPFVWFWDFGDGGSSTIQNPAHTYTSNGTYNVLLFISTVTGCSDTLTQSVTVTGCSSGSNCQAGFTATRNPANPCNIIFSSTSSGSAPFTYFWSFGDGNTSTSASPSHTYAGNGTYNVTLLVTDVTGCIDTVSQSVIVTGCGGATCMASFLAIPDSLNPCNYQFVDQSTGLPIAWAWDFGDGTTSLTQSPAKTYSTNGTYTVVLLITTASGCIDSVSQTITVSGCGTGGNCTASFFAVPDSTNPCTFFFINTSTGSTPITYRWAFGDGNVSTQQSPSHTYTANGTYTVLLTMVDANGCSATSTQTVVVTGCGSSTNCIAAFTAFPDSINPCIWYFIDQSTGSPVSWFWNFGDGNTSQLQSPVHTYTANGTYNVLLLMTTATGCVDTVFQTIVVSGCGGSSNCQAAFTAIADPNNPCTWDFINTSTATSGFFSFWNFGDGGTSNATSPSHTYANSGTYVVVLTITDSTGCTSSFTQTISVTGCGSTTCNADFTAIPDSTNPCSWIFIDQSTGRPVPGSGTLATAVVPTSKTHSRLTLLMAHM